MKVLDPGHTYELDVLDGGPPEFLVFVKRVGPDYPGNEPPTNGGPTSQEVIRVLIDRAKYVDGQKPAGENAAAIDSLRRALWYLEKRAARVRGEAFNTPLAEIELAPTCATCGHVQCSRHAADVPSDLAVPVRHVPVLLEGCEDAEWRLEPEEETP